VVVAGDWYYFPNTGRSYAHAKTDYAGSTNDSSFQLSDGKTVSFDGGSGAITATFKFTSYDSSNPSSSTWTSIAPTKIDDIRDGTANTLLLGEKRMNLGFLKRMFTDDNEGYTSGLDHDVMRSTNREPLSDFTDGNSSLYGDNRFGSSHPGGFNGALCDGSVRFIPYSIKLEVFKRLGCRQDGESFELP
jgi:prepilin-type processing-associated H-X9-DG protein